MSIHSSIHSSSIHPFNISSSYHFLHPSIHLVAYTHLSIHPSIIYRPIYLHIHPKASIHPSRPIHSAKCIHPSIILALPSAYNNWTVRYSHSCCPVPVIPPSSSSLRSTAGRRLYANICPSFSPGAKPRTPLNQQINMKLRPQIIDAFVSSH